MRCVVKEVMVPPLPPPPLLYIFFYITAHYNQLHHLNIRTMESLYKPFPPPPPPAAIIFFPAGGEWLAERPPGVWVGRRWGKGVSESLCRVFRVRGVIERGVGSVFLQSEPQLLCGEFFCFSRAGGGGGGVENERIFGLSDIQLECSNDFDY